MLCKRKITLLEYVFGLTLSFVLLLASGSCFSLQAADSFQYQYDTSGRLVKLTASNGLVCSYSYDANGNLVSETVDFDSDGDGLTDTIEQKWGCLNINDRDSDDDGIDDGVEDANHNGTWDKSETHPCRIDTDGDGIQDGTELGVTSPGADTDRSRFIPDADPSTTTDPLKADTDGDGFSDGEEDLNHNGRIDQGESDPNNRLSIPRGDGGFYFIRGKDGNSAVIYLE